MNSSVVSGGNIKINGVALSDLAAGASSSTYTITLTNDCCNNPTQTTTMTLTFSDPCVRAIYQTSPNPFAIVEVYVPSVFTITTPFHVKTDIETTYTYVCATTHAITTGYLPVSLASNIVEQHVINPS